MSNTMRKTVAADWAIKRLNDQIAQEDTVSGRMALCNFAISLLFECGRYAGFKYTNLEGSDETGWSSPDESCRFFFIKDVK